MAHLPKGQGVFLPPFQAWLANNIPAVYDNTLSYYEELCALIKYLQDIVVPAVNENASAVTTISEAVEKLQKYVEDYFENLDVQDEINNKIDEMVESGEFDTILANYLVISGGNAKALGCAGDGVTDDTTAINSAIASLKSLGTNKLVFPSGEYIVTDSISVPSDFVIEGMDGSVIKYTGEGKTGNIFNIIGEYGNYKNNITIKNLTIDASEQQYKGGASDATPLLTSTSPKYRGIVGIYGNYATNVLIDGCTLIDIYGDGIKFMRCSGIKVVNNNLSDCSGGNIRAGGDSGYDNFGDGIVCFASWDCLIDGNTIVNKRTYLTSSVNTDIGKLCGRSGTEYEYGLDHESEYSPHYDLFADTVAKGLVVSNNFIYGYTKGGHFETNVEVQFTNNTAVNNHIGCLLSVDGNSSVIGNLFDDNNVGQAPQAGYDGYHGGLALTTYGDYNEGKSVVSGNIFIGRSGRGITFGKDRVTIDGNTFYNANIGGVDNSANEAIISNNNFNESTVYSYQNKGWKILGNNFYATTANCIRVESCNGFEIDSNIFNNSIKFNSTNDNFTISRNVFNTTASMALYSGAFIDYFTGGDLNIDSNTFNMSANVAIKAINLSNLVKELRLNSNSFYGSSSNVNPVITSTAEIRNPVISYNKIYGFADGYKLMTHTWNLRSSMFDGNYSDNQFVYLYYQSAGTVLGKNSNIGNLCAIKYNSTPNDGASKFKDLYLSAGELISSYTGNTLWKVTRSGIYATDNYADGAVTVGKYVISNTDYVYKAETAGTASVAPSGTTTGGTETGSDGVKWICCGKVATLVTL